MVLLHVTAFWSATDIKRRVHCINRVNIHVLNNACSPLTVWETEFFYIIKIYPVVAEIGLAVPKSTQIRAMLKLIVFVILEKFSAANPVKFYGKQSLGCNVENFVNFGP